MQLLRSLYSAATTAPISRNDARRLLQVHDHAALAWLLGLPAEDLTTHPFTAAAPGPGLRETLAILATAVPRAWEPLNSAATRAILDDVPLPISTLAALNVPPAALAGPLDLRPFQRTWNDLRGERLSLLDPAGGQRVLIHLGTFPVVTLNARDAQLHGYLPEHADGPCPTRPFRATPNAQWRGALRQLGLSADLFYDRLRPILPQAAPPQDRARVHDLY
jgi:hypothetical protein